MTPATHTSSWLLVLIGWYLMLTPLIMLAWNVGLEPSGIAGTKISWVTALGLAVAFSLVRGLLTSMRRTVIVNNPSA